MNPLKYQLYLLQIENYEIKRYWSLLFAKGFYHSNSPLRKTLVWTKKIILLSVMSLIIFAITLLLFAKIAPIFGIIWLFVSFYIAPVYITVALLLITPIDTVAKKRVMSKAKNLINNSKLKIVGIAGSYGKTTLKNVMSSVLSQKFKVLVPPESINTAVGMSSWILKNYKDNSELLIVEFGEEYQGDNKRIAVIFPPDFTIITGINEAHFERIGSIEGVAATIFESVQYAKDNAKVFLNSSDNNVMDYYEHYVDKKPVEFFSGGETKSKIKVSGKSFDPKKLTWRAKVGELGDIETPVLGEYIFADFCVAMTVAKELGVNNAAIKKGLSQVTPVNHRLEPIRGAGDVLIIDDGYNGNPQGVEEAIKLLGRFTDHRKLYITPGLVETGERNKDVHTKIGELLSGVADKVILIKNSATPYIAEGLKNKKYKNKDIIWFDTATEAHASLSGILKPGDVILFQNDWGDQHL